ncbi:hypothetical protein BRC93_07330 [Halobacteriales archaeon QS_5_70_15]|nr:MAG: hypothetical protein BRC93_07330 [Halobacteriales archaeon QS_5_70_15]
MVVRVDLSNFNPARGRITLNLTADRSLVAQRTVTVGIDERRTVYLRTTLDDPGRYEMALNGVALGSVEVTTATEAPTTGDDRTTATPSATVALTPGSTAPEGGTSAEDPTGTATRRGTGTATTVGPEDPTGTDLIVAVGMSLMLLYGVGVAVYVLREQPPGGFE